MICKKCGNDAGTKAVCGGCGAVMGSAIDNTTCKNCGVARVPIKKKSTVSMAGIISVIGFIAGTIIFLGINMSAGILTIIASILIGTLLRPENTFMVCPNCGDKGQKL